MSSNSSKSQTLATGLLLAAVTSLILYQLYQQFDQGSSSSSSSSSKELGKGTSTSSVSDTAAKRAANKARDLPQSQTPPPPSSSSSSDAATPVASNTSGSGAKTASSPASINAEKALHARIEELDKKGKGLFKAKKFLEAAQVFTDALELIEQNDTDKKSSSLARQAITLTNNRSAMYEKAGLPDLALEDCRVILEDDVGHDKARTRRLRILESQKNYSEALVDVCALQLKFMQDNRHKLRMGIEVKPPVPQSKLEEFLQHLLPGEVDRYVQNQKDNPSKQLPSSHTLSQLLKSFSGYNSWMATAARSGTVDILTTSLDSETDVATKAGLYMKRGRRHVYDENYKAAVADFEAGLNLVDGKPEIQALMDGDDLPRLLEWAAMGRHWQYDLDGAFECYERCFEQESTNVSIGDIPTRREACLCGHDAMQTFLLVSVIGLSHTYIYAHIYTHTLTLDLGFHHSLSFSLSFSGSLCCSDRVAVANSSYLRFLRWTFLSKRPVSRWMRESKTKRWRCLNRPSSLNRSRPTPCYTVPTCTCCSRTYQRPRPTWTGA